MEHKRHIEQRVESKVEHYVKKAVKVFVFAIFIIGLFFLACYILMRLWNWLMPDLFDLISITYMQAVGLMIIAKLIFGFGGGGSSSKNNGTSKKWKKRKCGTLKKDLEDWKQYDRFWKEEGEAAFKNYVKKQKNDGETKKNEE